MSKSTAWAALFVDELARAGLAAVCIAPGSRSTPLTLAFAKHEGIKSYLHLDERSAAFFALGLAAAADAPVALVCTSGTAAANFFPAVVEAHQSRVPLIVLTADRPPELRHSGANQTIDQIKLYGDYALWAVDAALPEDNPPAVAIRNLRTLADRAYAVANGLRKGVVHINMPFRKPLEPTADDAADLPADAEARPDGKPYTHFAQMGQPGEDLNILIQLEREMPQATRGLVVLGPKALQKHLMLLRDAPYPVLADGLSGARFGAGGVFGAYDSFLNTPAAGDLQPDVIFQVGGLPTSAALNAYLSSRTPERIYQISPDGVWADDSHRTTHFVQADASSALVWLKTFFGKGHNKRWREAFEGLERTAWEVIDREIENGAYFDGAAVYDVIDLIPTESTLFIGNSLPVRHLDQFGKPGNKRVYVYANRGASGIDGNLSSALGTGRARPDKPLVAIVGDVTFYHDMNGLMAIHKYGLPVTIVLLNNDGGGIFHRLPIKDFDPEFTEYFITAHGLDFEPAIRMYGLDYVRAHDRESFRRAFTESVSSGASRVIELRTQATVDLARRNAIIAAVQQAITASAT